MRDQMATRNIGLGGLVSVTIGVALLSAGLIMSAPAADASAKKAPRSTEVSLTNRTGCDLLLLIARLDHGEWTTEPPHLIGRGRAGTWGSESAGVLTGTEGAATYLTQSCLDPNLDKMRIRFHWNNPFVGSTSYDTAGTDEAFHAGIVGSDETHAKVNVEFRP